MKLSLSRRSFLKMAALASSAAAFPCPVRGAGKTVTRVLGRTGLKVSEVGMGVMITGDPAIVRASLDAGINYFDTARAYLGGRNEEIVAEGLKGRRQEAILATKCHRLESRDSIYKCCEESLKALKTDTIDVFQYHGLSSRGQVLHPEHLEAVRKLRQDGKIRFAGVSTHGGMEEVIDAAVEAGVYDMVLTVLNYQSAPEVAKAVERAAAAGLGVVAMKVMSGGYDLTIPGLSPRQSQIRWVLMKKGVSCAIPSMTTLEQVKEDAAVMGSTFSWRDRAPLALYAAAVDDRFCRMCGECLPQCPAELDIPRAMRALMYAEGYRQPELARETLAGFDRACAGCDVCAVTCRYGLDVRSRMEAAAALAAEVRA